MSSSYTQEILANATPQAITRTPASNGFEILNLGPAPIWVAVNDMDRCVIGACRRVQPDESWSIDCSSRLVPYIVCEYAQVTGAATIMTEY